MDLGLLYKSVPFETKEVVEVGDGGWEIAGYASTFGGEPDFYGDVIAPGAFAVSIAAYKPKFLFEHAMPIGRTLEITEDDHGLFGRWSIVNTATGTDAYKLAKAGVLDSLSIGFFPEEWAYRDDGARLLIRCDLPEVSAVAIPANRHAVITDVKRWQPGAPIETAADAAHRGIRSLIDRVRSDGRERRSSSDLAVLASLADALAQASDELDALLLDGPPGQKRTPRSRSASNGHDDVDLDAVRARLQRLGVLVAAGE